MKSWQKMARYSALNEIMTELKFSISPQDFPRTFRNLIKLKNGKYQISERSCRLRSSSWFRFLLRHHPRQQQTWDKWLNKSSFNKMCLIILAADFFFIISSILFSQSANLFRKMIKKMNITRWRSEREASSRKSTTKNNKKRLSVKIKDFCRTENERFFFLRKEICCARKSWQDGARA